MCPSIFVPKPATSLNLLLAMAALTSGEPSSYSSTLRAVEPVLHVVAAHEHARLVPLADRTQRLVRGRGQDVVEGGRLPVRSHLGVGMAGVVQHLVLVGDRARRAAR